MGAGRGWLRMVLLCVLLLDELLVWWPARIARWVITNLDATATAIRCKHCDRAGLLLTSVSCHKLPPHLAAHSCMSSSPQPLTQLPTLPRWAPL